MTRDELGALILRSEDMLYRIAKSLLRSDADCADAIQNTILRAFDHIGSLRHDEFARTWLVRILINECKTMHRRNLRLLPLTDQQTQTPAPETHSDLYDALHRLPEPMRLAITLHYFDGFSVREIAQLTHCTESAVKSRLSRARTQLKNQLEE